MDKTTKYKIIIAVTDVEMNSIWSNLVNIRKTNFEMYNLHMMSMDWSWHRINIWRQNNVIFDCIYML